MDEVVLKIALAGLTHDVGKFAGRDVLDASGEYINNNLDLYCPTWNRRHTHEHAVYTAAFIEHMKDILPPELNSPGWGKGDSFVNLAAGHHKPETPLQWIVAISDRISSGLDREEFENGENYIPFREYRKTRLHPLFEKIGIDRSPDGGAGDDPGYRYPLKTLTHATIFPRPKDDVAPSDKNEALEEYIRLFGEFKAALEKLAHRNDDLELWCEHFESLLSAFTSGIPSARAGNVVPDVSLYDHLRSTAALAAALYVYHRDNQTLTIENVKDYNEAKFLIIGGDFYGIQDYIFSAHGDVRKHRAKLLRGRSFSVSLFSELAADMICREIGLPFLNVVLSAAGKFTIIAPNTKAAGKAMETACEKINDWLVRLSYGENSLGVSTVEATPADFVQGRFHQLWDRLQAETASRKFNRVDLEKHGGAFGGYLDGFDNDPDRRALCPLCGKRPSTKEASSSRHMNMDEKGSCCALCRDHVFLGASLVKKNRLAIYKAGTETATDENRLFEPIFGEYQAGFVEDGKTGIRGGRLLRCWNLAYDFNEGEWSDVAVKFINGYIPQFRDKDEYDPRYLAGGRGEEKKLQFIDEIRVGEPKTFGCIAAMSRNLAADGETVTGTEALGVLKADVDNLGLILACGLDEKTLSISRLSTLSRQLNFFFTMFLPHMLENDDRFEDVYTVFAGGDDLFLIGPWNGIIELTGALKDTFADYVCRNEDVHFSAGIALHKNQTPIDAMARAAEEALEASKDDGRNRLTLFGETIHFDDFDRLMDVKERMLEWLDREWISRVMLYRLNEIIEMAGMEKRLLNKGGGQSIRIDDLSCVRWRALLAYGTERNIGKSVKGEERTRAAAEVRTNLTEWLSEFGRALRIPLWQILYNIRRR